MEKLWGDLVIRGRQGRPLDIEQVVRDVREAREHLRRLAYCHNDVIPQNIMFTEDDRAALIDIDFHACLPEGDQLRKGPLAVYSTVLYMYCTLEESQD